MLFSKHIQCNVFLFDSYGKYILQDVDSELCCICFNQVCTIEVQDCGHQMCARCTLALCCHKKPNSTTLCATVPVCPFCRSNIAQLAVAKTRVTEDVDKDSISRLRKARRSPNFSEGSSSFKGLSSAMGSLGKMAGRGLGKRSDSISLVDKPVQILAL